MRGTHGASHLGHALLGVGFGCTGGHHRRVVEDLGHLIAVAGTALDLVIDLLEALTLDAGGNQAVGGVVELTLVTAQGRRGRGHQADLLTIGLQVGFGVFQVGAQLVQTVVQPAAGGLLHVEARVQVGRDVGLGRLVGDLGGQHRIRGLEADLDQLTVLDGRDVQARLVAHEDLLFQGFLGQFLHVALGGLFLAFGGELGIEVGVVLKAQRLDDADAHLARTHELGLRLEELAAAGGHAIDLFQRHHTALVVLDEDGGAGLIDGRHQVDGHGGQHRDDGRRAEHQPFAFPDDAQVGAEGGRRAADECDSGPLCDPDRLGHGQVVVNGKRIGHVHSGRLPRFDGISEADRYERTAGCLSGGWQGLRGDVRSMAGLFRMPARGRQSPRRAGAGHEG